MAEKLAGNFEVISINKRAIQKRSHPVNWLIKKILPGISARQDTTANLVEPVLFRARLSVGLDDIGLGKTLVAGSVRYIAIDIQFWRVKTQIVVRHYVHWTGGQVL